MKLDEALRQMEAMANPRVVEAAARFGVVVGKRFGLTAPQVHALAGKIGRDHELAQQLWATGNDDARSLATMIEEPVKVTERQMERWAKDFRSWDLCDCACCYLFDRTPFAWRKAAEWSRREEEFVKRAGFALMAYLASHDKSAPDRRFLPFLTRIRQEATDERNFVKKAVNWALRQIGKRNLALNARAIQAAEAIRKMDSPAARWIAAGALRELRSEAVQTRLRKEK